MAQVTVQINGRAYQVACGDGEQERIAGLAAYVDGKVQELVEAIGNVGDQRLLVMASLLLADEIFEGKDNSANGKAAQAEKKRADAIEALAERIERLAARLETA
jgi:cell division protein ZapA